MPEDLNPDVAIRKAGGAGDFTSGFASVDDMPSDSETAAAKVRGQREYAPTEWTMKRLAELDKVYTIENNKPVTGKEFIRNRYGIDIDTMLKTRSAKMSYDVLGRLAAGDTTAPVTIRPKVGFSRLEANVTIRMKWAVNEKDQLYISEPELHQVKLTPRMDKDGKPVIGQDGKVEMAYDRNPIEPPKPDENGILRYEKPMYAFGERLSDDEIDQLRLTGMLHEPKLKFYENSDGSKRTVAYVVACDPYNNQELCRLDSNTISRRLANYDETRYYRGKEVRTVQLPQKEKNLLAAGKQVWLKDNKDEYILLQYNPAQGKIETCTDFKAAKRQEVVQAESKYHAQKMAESQKNAKDLSTGQKV